MEFKNEELEEGEISNDDDIYKPLERPINYSSSIVNPRLPPEIDHESESDSDSLSSSSSDSDIEKKKLKRPKLKPIRRRNECKTKKKYDIWSTRAQEDVLTETLQSCDVSYKDRSRTVETYLPDFFINNEEFQERIDSFKNYDIKRTSNKRTYKDRKNSNLKLHQNKETKKNHDKKGKPRIINDLTCTDENTVEEIAKEMAEKLNEEKEDIIGRLVEIAGIKKAFEIFKETKKIEEEGGMLIMNQSRRRTPGGVFFFLIKHDPDLTREQTDKIFDDKKCKKNKKVSGDSNKTTDGSCTNFLTKGQVLLNKCKNLGGDNETVVKNPPPSPVADIHDHVPSISKEEITRRLTSYEDDILDLNTENMDFF